MGGTVEHIEYQSESQSQGESQMESQSMLGPAVTEAKYPYPTPSLQIVQGLLNSIPKEATEENFGMRAITRWIILSSVLSEAGWGSVETWILAGQMHDWVAGVEESVKAGFEADEGAGATGTLWSAMRDQCKMLLL